MKELVKGIIAWAAFVGIPIVAIGATSVNCYKSGYNDGSVESIKLVRKTLADTFGEIEKRKEK